MEGESNDNHLNFFLPMDHSTTTTNTSDLDFSFNSTASTSTFASTSTSSARSSLSLNFPSSSPSTSLIDPLPHSNASSDSYWSSLRAAASLSKDGNLHLRHLRLLRHIGSGHLAKVFHCRLKGSDDFDFALKVIDLEASGKLSHVKTEAQVLASLDHPFLPTLYARLDASHYSCFLIDYCPGGDLHSLLVRHPAHRLPISTVRFFAAEVLLALEYLHAQGFVYRDLKPENVLIRSDGHIMLSDFDLCFSSEVNPRLDREFGFIAEPEGASHSCVGTHEYLAPEIVNGNGHGSGVDWWAFGVFVYELLYGRTPFKGSSKEATLKNILRRELKFSDAFKNDEMRTARDLIRRLLVKDPRERLGSRKGAAEIKTHKFFEGVKWPLIRSLKSPVVVGPKGAVVAKQGKRRGWWKAINVCYKKSTKMGTGYKNKRSVSSKKGKRTM